MGLTVDADLLIPILQWTKTLEFLFLEKQIKNDFIPSMFTVFMCIKFPLKQDHNCLLFYLASRIKRNVLSQCFIRSVSSESHSLIFWYTKHPGKKLSISLLTFRMWPTLQENIHIFNDSFRTLKCCFHAVMFLIPNHSIIIWSLYNIHVLVV